MRKPFLIIALLCALVVSADAKRTTTLTWDASPDADVVGYRVEYGPLSGVYTERVDVPNTTTVSIEGLKGSGKYFFVVKAVNTAGLVSEPSNEVDLPPISGYEEWSEQIDDLVQRDATADLDKDGLTNLVEYALGRQPGSAESTPSLDLDVSGSTLTVQFSHPSDRAGVQYILQESGDVLTWRSVNDLEQNVDGTNTTQSIQRELAGAPTVFYRLQILTEAHSSFTPPYGVVGIVIKGSKAGSQEAVTTRFGLGVTRPVELTGNVEAVGTDTISDSEANWQDGQFEGPNGSYLLEITSGPGAGTNYDIVETSASDRTIRVAQPLVPNLVSGFTYQIRKHWTLASVFGLANEAGLNPADRVIVYNKRASEQYYFDPSVGWRSVDNPGAYAPDAVFYPEDCISVETRTPGNRRIFLNGEVKRTVTSVPVLPGVTLCGNVYAGAMTLESSGLYTGDPTTGIRSGTASNSDRVVLSDGMRDRTFYYNLNRGWRELNSNNRNAGNTPIPVSGTVMIVRGVGEGFNWVPPVHPAGL